ncbi:hypothetical protein M947_08055 [Sulfurimonas hongkongensis]|uniref:GGDEF domain-containing protein n=1 Tax=Sulfurimonas hongkongensis TaxID=1172190 RepID=T0KPQ9_9BACT|nr:LapD/MoxY N-terminal periplasmic domain-containing protein [Sulfurimonas hongkongensis]EQB39104.1 hypothetical protein M947_08055 [Sulfurimonas hongkongensis]
MTLFKQIAFMLSIFLLIFLATVLTLNFKSANNSVQERLYEDAKNSATSLSLSLGSANGDISIMTTMINANFDSGNYRRIVLKDVDEALIYDRELQRDTIDVPSWFLELVNIEAPVASANVSSGWNQVGILSVQSDDSYAYKQLYTILIDLLISSSIIFIIGLIVLNLLLVAILKPLKGVQKQAEAIIRNEFIIQQSIPSTVEFKDVVLGMNNMVSKVKAMLAKASQELKYQKELEYIDKVTGLKNRKYLIDKLPEYLKVDAASKGGINMMISISGMIEANEQIGHKEVDKLLLSMANIFDAHATNYENSIVSRMNGTEFSILLPDCLEKDGLILAKNIYNSCQKITKGFELDASLTYISLGLYEYNYKDSIGELLSQSDNALTQAKFSDIKIYLAKAQTTVDVMGKDAWRELIKDAVKDKHISFAPYKVVDAKRKKIVHNILSINLKIDKETIYYYGQFMAPANQAGLSSKIYDNVLDMMFKTPDISLKNLVCSLRLPYDYLVEEGTFDKMHKLFFTHAKALPFRLIVEVPDKFMHQNSIIVKNYKALFDKYNIDMGVFEFIGESVDYQYLQEFRPVYIKAQGDFFLTQSNQALVALRLITDTMGISLIASGVMQMDMLKRLLDKDINIVQGKVSEMIKLL